MKLPGKILACALLFIGLVLVNYLASSLPVRLDLTAESIYSLSPGTRAVLAKIEEPVVLDLYFSKNASGLPIAYKNYATRVQEMLRQYVRAARGKLVLNVIDPRPDTPAEEKATGAGLTPQVAPTGGEQFFFGLVATQADQQKNIPAFTPQREQFLEYDLSKLVYSVQLLDKPRLGLITSLPLQGASAQELQLARLLHRPAERGQMVASEWEQSFQIEKIEGNAPALPANLDALAVIHPQNLSPKLQYAVDQFLLAGKPVFLALDPSSQYSKNQGGGQMAMMGGSPGASSDLPRLLKAYDIVYDPQQVVGDLINAANVRTESGDTRYPVWLSLGAENFNPKWLPTAQIKSAVFIEAGSLGLKSGSSLAFTPVVETSAQSGEMPGAMLQFAQTEEIARQIKPTGKKTIAAIVTGKFQTAFPDGPPKEEKTPAPGAKPGAEKPADEAKPADSLKMSRSTSTLFVIADTDWLFDDYSVRKFNFFGQTAAEPLNDNLTLASNAVDFLGGSPDLISIRGKGSSLRPFTAVQKMEVEAQKKYQEKLTELDARLQTVQSKLSELQGGKTEGSHLVASPEMQKAIEDFQKQSAALRGERREIRRALREDIDALENRLLVINLLAAPLLVGVFGLLFHRARRA